MVQNELFGGQRTGETVRVITATGQKTGDQPKHDQQRATPWSKISPFLIHGMCPLNA
jgi:hypothetical protein